MKKLNYLIFFMLVIIFASCGFERPEYTHYTYETYIEVKYEDNTVDTLKDVRNVYYKSKPRYEIQTSVSGLINVEKITPCLTVSKPYRNTNIACYVKNFKILSQNKYGID